MSSMQNVLISGSSPTAHVPSAGLMPLKLTEMGSEDRNLPSPPASAQTQRDQHKVNQPPCLSRMLQLPPPLALVLAARTQQL